MARKSIANASAQPSDEEQGYDSGFLAAAEWHDQKAREAELQADREPNPDRKQKFRKRAERHRLYSRQLRKELEHLRSEEHTSELLSLMRISYAAFCWKKKQKNTTNEHISNNQIDQTQ